MSLSFPSTATEKNKVLSLFIVLPPCSVQICFDLKNPVVAYEGSPGRNNQLLFRQHIQECLLLRIIGRVPDEAK